MVQTHELPSGWSTGVNSPNRTLVDPVETIGSPDDKPAVHADDESTAFELAKGICRLLFIPVGTGVGVTNVAPRVNTDLFVTLGTKEDAAASNPNAPSSAIALLKGIAAALGL